MLLLQAAIEEQQREADALEAIGVKCGEATQANGEAKQNGEDVMPKVENGGRGVKRSAEQAAEAAQACSGECG